jgi:outer membrane protein assembly factor BamB
MSQSNDDMFTPDEVDEQIEQYAQYAQSHNPAQRQEESTPASRLLADLQEVYPPDVQDTRSLEHVWNRLAAAKARSSSSSALSEPLSRDQHREQDTRERRNPMQSNLSISRRSKMWQQRIAVIAAVALLTLVVGSLVVVLNMAHQGKSTRSNHAPSLGNSTGTVSSTPLSVYLGSVNMLYKLDAKSGAKHWQYQTPSGQPIQLPPVVANGTVYFTALDNYLYAVNASNGKLLWHVKVKNDSQLSVGSPLVAGNTVYVSGTNECVYAFNASNGNLIRCYPIQQNSGSLQAVVNGIFYVEVTNETPNTLPSSTLYAFRTSDGSQLWAKITPIKDQLYAYGTLHIVGGVVYIASSAIDHHTPTQVFVSYVYAFDAASGQLLGQSEQLTGNVSTLSVANGVVYLSTSESILNSGGPGYIYAFDANTTHERWHYTLPGAFAVTMSVGNDQVYVGVSGQYAPSTANTITAINASDGTKLWQQVQQYYSGGSVTVNSGILYIGTNNTGGLLLALKASSGAEIWHFAIMRFFEPGYVGQIVVAP